MLDYGAVLPAAPAAVSGEAIDRLRAAGLDDRGIHDLCAITAYFGFVNRIADGLGVQLENPSDPPARPV
jgi:alkylhydroperoxidase family enzyme